MSMGSLTMKSDFRIGYPLIPQDIDVSYLRHGLVAWHWEKANLCISINSIS